MCARCTTDVDRPVWLGITDANDHPALGNAGQGRPRMRGVGVASARPIMHREGRMSRSSPTLAVAGATGILGSRLVAVAEARGHRVLELCRARGVDLVTGIGAFDLTGVSAVIDATCSGAFTGSQGRAFYEAVTRRLGVAAEAAGVARTVVVSQLGAGRTRPEHGPLHEFMSGKIAQERAAAVHTPGLRIVRAAQSHEVAERQVVWYRDGHRVPVPALAIQPIELDALAAFVLDLAGGAGDGMEHGEIVELAGPQVEILSDMVSRIDETVIVDPEDPGSARTVMLPGPYATLVGRTFDDWAISPSRSAHPSAAREM
jgi:uncharacterized protein YbjT (DUF2867 family)